VKKLETTLAELTTGDKEWEALDALLLRAAVAEPGALPTILRIFEHHTRNPQGLCDALESICLYHAGLQQASEVAWALWTAKRLEIPLSTEVANAVETVDDDIVALVALELRENGLLPTPDNQFALWSGYMTAEHLYSDHWLLAYEAFEQGWLPALNNTDYTVVDPYFQILKKHSVRFYDTSAEVEAPDSGYNDDDDDDDSELLEDDDDGDDGEENAPDADHLTAEEIRKMMEHLPPNRSDTTLSGHSASSWYLGPAHPILHPARIKRHV